MFISIGKYTINSDNIMWAEDYPNGITIIHFTSGKGVQITTAEAALIWHYIDRPAISLSLNLQKCRGDR